MSIATLKKITQQVRDALAQDAAAAAAEQGQVEGNARSSPCGIADNLALLTQIDAFMAEDGVDVDIVPKVWTQWIDTTFIMPLWNPRFWESVTSKECYMFTKQQRRYFPMVGSAEWKATADTSLKANYPEFDAQRPANYRKSDNNTKLHTNFGMVPPFDTKSNTVEVDILARVITLLIRLADEALQNKIWYFAATNYEMCHIVLKHNVGRRLTRTVWARARDLVQAGLFWTMYILAHEENTSNDTRADVTEQTRFVFTLDEVNHLDFLNNLPPDSTPWIVNAMRNGNNIYNTCPFYLTGNRSVSTPAVAKERIRHLTRDCFRGFERFTNAALTGSILMQCLGNNALLKRQAAGVAADGGIVISQNTKNELPMDIASFEHRSRLYFPKEGEMSSDLDVLVSCPSYKEFIATAEDMVAQLGTNLGSPVTVVHDTCQSGVRYHVSHPALDFTIEIYRSPLARARLTSGFHVPPARMYWNFHPDMGKNLFMTRACAGSLVTGIGADYNWFSSNKVPADVTLKYAQRGVTIPHNYKELECLSKYLETSDRWGYGFYKIMEITGAFTHDHPFFRVDAIPRGIRYGLPQIPAAVGGYRNNVYTLARKLKWGGAEFRRYEERGIAFCVVAPPLLFSTA